MTAQESHIYPIFSELLQRTDKEKLLKQKAIVIWMTGLSGSGKSTLAKGLEKKLYQDGFLSHLLDGDNVRSGINSDLRFSDTDRKENIRRIAEISKLFLDCGIITINCFVSPTKEIRKMAETIIGAKDFFEIFIHCPLNICEERDVKGLYKKARSGEIKDFTGINAPFEEPENARLMIRTDLQSAEKSVNELYKYILPYIQLEKKRG